MEYLLANQHKGFLVTTDFRDSRGGEWYLSGVQPLRFVTYFHGAKRYKTMRQAKEALVKANLECDMNKNASWPKFRKIREVR